MRPFCLGGVRVGEEGMPPLLLAPMEDVSDPPFRKLCKEQGADLLYTEFISSEGLIRHAIKSQKKLDIFSYERPIGVQLFGHDIDSMVRAAALAEEVQPDLIDINYGCPVKKVTCKGGGAGILLDLPKMQSMTEEIVKRVRIPVTVKTRLGWDRHSIRVEEVALRLQDAGVQALTIHARTRQQMYKGEADWSYIGKIKENDKIHIPIFGNGDLDSPQKAYEYHRRYGPDGLMLGRATIGYPWIFREIKHYFRTQTRCHPPSLEERTQAILKHLRLSVSWKGERVGLYEMRRHYSNYLRGEPHMKARRQQLVLAESIGEVEETLAELAPL